LILKLNLILIKSLIFIYLIKEKKINKEIKISRIRILIIGIKVFIRLVYWIINLRNIIV
jgi:hypothetical protein